MKLKENTLGHVRRSLDDSRLAIQSYHLIMMDAIIALSYHNDICLNNYETQM